MVPQIRRRDSREEPALDLIGGGNPVRPTGHESRATDDGLSTAKYANDANVEIYREEATPLRFVPVARRKSRPEPGFLLEIAGLWRRFIPADIL